MNDAYITLEKKCIVGFHHEVEIYNFVNLWNVTPIHGEGCILQIAQCEKGIFLTNV